MSGELSCFKAYDIRGRIPDELNEDLAYRIGRAYAAFLQPRRVAVIDLEQGEDLQQRVHARGCWAAAEGTPTGKTRALSSAARPAAAHRVVGVGVAGGGRVARGHQRVHQGFVFGAHAVVQRG